MKILKEGITGLHKPTSRVLQGALQNLTKSDYGHALLRGKGLQNPEILSGFEPSTPSLQDRNKEATQHPRGKLQVFTLTMLKKVTHKQSYQNCLLSF